MKMSDFTPTTEELISGYVDMCLKESGETDPNTRLLLAIRFNDQALRWLEQHDREVAANGSREKDEEIRRLRAWKSQARESMKSLRELGKEANVRLGQNIIEGAIEEIKALREVHEIVKASEHAAKITGTSVENVAEAMVRVGYDGLRQQLREQDEIISKVWGVLLVARKAEDDPAVDPAVPMSEIVKALLEKG